MMRLPNQRCISFYFNQSHIKWLENDLLWKVNHLMEEMELFRYWEQALMNLSGSWHLSSAVCQGHGVISLTKLMSQASYLCCTSQNRNEIHDQIMKNSPHPNVLCLYFSVLFTSVQFIIIHFSTMWFIGMAVESEMPKHQDKRSTFSLSAGLIRS